MTSAVNSSDLVPVSEHRTVTRVMAIIELVVGNEPSGVRLADMAAAIGAPKSLIHGLAKGLVATGYLREEDGRYLFGPAISGLLSGARMSVPSAYHHTLEQLSARWNETAMLATLVGDSIVYLNIVEPDTLIRASAPLNRHQPLWPRSSGKCFLAFMEPRRVEAYLRRHQFDLAERDCIRAELQTVKRPILRSPAVTNSAWPVRSPLAARRSPWPLPWPALSTVCRSNSRTSWKVSATLPSPSPAAPRDDAGRGLRFTPGCRPVASLRPSAGLADCAGAAAPGGRVIVLDIEPRFRPAPATSAQPGPQSDEIPVGSDPARRGPRARHLYTAAAP